MKKSLIFAGMLVVGFANAQYEGKVGVNTETPKATLEVQPNATNLAGTTNEGLLIPRLSKERVAKMASPETSTLVYVNEATTYTTGTDTAADTRVAKIDAVGFYHYNGTQWVKHLDTDTNDAEWVYDATANRINLKRSGAGTMANSVFYDANTGQYVDIDDENNIREGRLNNTNGILSAELVTRSFSSGDMKYRNFVHSESANLPLSTGRAANGTIVSRYKQLGSYNLVASESDTTNRLYSVYSKILVPPTNANNYVAVYGNDSGVNLFGTGTVTASIGQTGSISIGNSQKVTSYITGLLGSSSVNTSGTVANVYGTTGRVFYYSPTGATVEASAAGYFTSATPFTDNSLINQNIGVYSILNNNSQNTGTGKFMAGLYASTRQMGKIKYPNMYGIYTMSAIAPTAVAPTNNYGLYIADVKGGETLNRAIHTEAGKIRFGDLADATATADRVVTVDANGVLKVGNAYATNTTNSLWTRDEATNTIKLAVNSDGTDRTNAVTIDNAGAVYASSLKGYNGATIFPDYVFQKYYTGNSSIKADYTFKSLSQVEDFVKTNGHLPGYKSAEAIKAQGYVDLMETQLTNVEKIEELYLHSIEQEKNLKELRKENEELKARLEKLEKLLK
ncbi:bZIP transcription factor [Bergeyella porcorum]|uniref:bZIP transcription factor n=1 Tax=Bergeyella porcorum TaxID=1735111 RepID=UPI0035E4B709